MSRPGAEDQKDQLREEIGRHLFDHLVDLVDPGAEQTHLFEYIRDLVDRFKIAALVALAVGQVVLQHLIADVDIGGKEAVHHIHAVERGGIEDRRSDLACAVLGQVGGHNRCAQAPADQVDLAFAGRGEHLVDIGVEQIRVGIGIQAAVIGEIIVVQRKARRLFLRLRHRDHMGAAPRIAVAVHHQRLIARIQHVVDFVGKDLPVFGGFGGAVCGDQPVHIVFDDVADRLFQRIELIARIFLCCFLGIDVNIFADHIDDRKIGRCCRGCKQRGGGQEHENGHHKREETLHLFFHSDTSRKKSFTYPKDSTKHVFLQGVCSISARFPKIFKMCSIV